MSLGNSLFHARKKSGMLQEEVAERLGVSRQAIGRTMPDKGNRERLAGRPKTAGGFDSQKV